MMTRQISAVLLLATSSCGPKSGVGLDPLTLDVAPRPDSGPVLTRHTGRLEVLREPAATARAVGRAEHDGHIYVCAHSDGADLPDDARLRLADLSGAAFPCGRSDTCLRFRASQSLPESIAVELTVPADLGSWSSAPRGTERDLIVSAVRAAPEDAAVPGRWLRCAGEALHEYGHRDILHNDAFFEFARHRLEAMSTGRVRAPSRMQDRRGRRTEVGETMALYTGWTSVEEALQTDRGLLVRAPSASRRTLPIESVAGVPLAEHPWSRMISELGRPPATEPLAAFVPNDVIYLHFHDLRSLVLLAKEIDDWASPVVQIVDRKAGATHFAARYERQLGIERMGLAETLGHVAARGVALVAGDPFLREGTDVSLLFHVRSETLLERALTTYEERARERRADARVSTYEVGGHTVRLFGTADRVVHQHRISLGDVLILSNSRRAIERFVAVERGELTSLAASGDFRYMRTLYPFDQDSEDGFAFAGDALVARVVGPRLKILSGRRMEARADLAAVNYAALLYGWLEGKPAAAIDDVIAAGYLARRELAHADGTPIAFSSERGASSGSGTVARLQPLLELDIAMATPEEKAAYERFRDTYQRNWTGFIDPIAARIRRSGDGKALDIDARMLPLIESSDYDELISMVGQATVTSPPRANGIQWTVAVGREARLRRTVDGLARQITGSGEISIGWLGDWVMVGAGDRSGLWDLVQWGGKMPDVRTRRAVKEEGRARQAQVLAHLPLYAGAHVTNRLALAATLAGIKGFVESAAPGLVEWGADTPYRDVPVVRLREKPLPDRPPQFGITLRYATVGDVFIVALERETLEAQVDALLDGRFAVKTDAPPEEQAPQAIVSVRTAAADSWLTRTAAGVMEDATLSSNRAAFRSMELLWRGLGGLPSDLEATGLGYLGYEPRFANGGTFTVNSAGVMVHSLYGSELEPRVPEVPIPGAAITRVLESMRLLELGVGFEGEGEHRGLHATVRLRRRQ